MLIKAILWIKWKLINLLIKLRIKEDDSPKDYYISMFSEEAPWVYSYYLSDPFYHKDEKSYLNSHQNRREAIVMVEIWNELGYNVYVQNFDSNRRLPRLKNVEIVFGHEPKFEEACELYHPKFKVAYATGCYCDHQTNQVRLMTDYFNSKYSANIPYRREASHHESYAVSDKILLIGSKYTIKTLPENCQNKVGSIHQSTQSIITMCGIEYAKENEFFFMGSYGNMLRGIPLLVEYFTEHTNLILHIVGPIEDDVLRVIRPSLSGNIRLHGFMNVNSDEFLSLIARCNFIIYPSGSEGGCPGSVLNSMKNGLIPIVTPWAAFDEIEEYGYLMKTWDLKGIENGVDWALSLSVDDIQTKKKKCADFVKNTYTLDRFICEFTYFFKNLQISQEILNNR